MNDKVTISIVIAIVIACLGGLLIKGFTHNNNEKPPIPEGWFIAKVTIDDKQVFMVLCNDCHKDQPKVEKKKEKAKARKKQKEK